MTNLGIMRATDGLKQFILTVPIIKPKNIPNGGSVHANPSLATDSADPLTYPPPTIVAIKE